MFIPKVRRPIAGDYVLDAHEARRDVEADHALRDRGPDRMMAGTRRRAAGFHVQAATRHLVAA
jgi:hypothetical protein